MRSKWTKTKHSFFSSQLKTIHLIVTCQKLFPGPSFYSVSSESALTTSIYKHNSFIAQAFGGHSFLVVFTEYHECMLVLLDVCFWYLKEHLDLEMRAHDVRLIISGILDSDWSVPTFWGVLFHDNNTLIWVFEFSASFTSLISRFAKGWNISRNFTKIPRRLQKILESFQHFWNIFCCCWQFSPFCNPTHFTMLHSLSRFIQKHLLSSCAFVIDCIYCKMKPDDLI